jgi:ABC-type oligopeptide transport system substrate-binding subunit
MKKLKVFMFLLACLLVLSLILSSCEKTKDGEVKVTNSSPYVEDNPVNVQLIKNYYGDNNLLAEEDVTRNRSVTFTGVPPEAPLTMKITDKDGRVVSISFSLLINEKLAFKYKGESPIEYTSKGGGGVSWGEIYY